MLTVIMAIARFGHRRHIDRRTHRTDEKRKKTTAYAMVVIGT
jgi:hypothetical protein